MTRLRVVLAVVVCGLVLHMFSGVLGLTTDASTRTLRNADPGPVPGGSVGDGSGDGDAGGVPGGSSGADDATPAMVDLSDPGAAAPGFQPAAETSVDGVDAPVPQVESVSLPAAVAVPASAGVATGVAPVAPAAPTTSPAAGSSVITPSGTEPPAPTSPVATAPVATAPVTTVPITTVTPSSIGATSRTSPTTPTTPTSPTTPMASAAGIGVDVTTTLPASTTAATGRPPVPTSPSTTVSSPSTASTTTVTPTTRPTPPATTAPAAVPPVTTAPVTIPPTTRPITPATIPPTSPAATPSPTGGPAIDTRLVPAGSAGVEVATIAASSRTPTTSDGVGAFRTFCGMSHMAFDDPIVAPGRPGASHLHTFFGNTGVDAFSNAATIAGSGGSTCRGGTANRSAYWVPSMIDTSTGAAVAPAFLISYYKSGYLGVSPSEIQAFPSGLRMISGRSTASAPDPAPSWRRPVNWNCGFDSTGNGTEFSPGMQQCAPGQFVRLTLAFPQCWNGRDLDSADHQSHMAWADGTGCPSSHPVAVPQVTMNFYWPVPSGGNAGWRLASDMYDGGTAGWSGHADWWNGWDPAVEQVWIDRCVRAGLDCSVEMLGDGRELVGGSF